MNFLEVQLLARYTNGLRDPIRRFVLPHDPKTFKEAVEIATREERNESIVADNQPVRALCEKSDQVEDLRLHLDRLEKMLVDKLSLRHRPEPVKGLSKRRNHPRGCFLCGEVGHFVRKCPLRVSQGRKGTEVSLPERSSQTFPMQVANQAEEQRVGVIAVGDGDASGEVRPDITALFALDHMEMEERNRVMQLVEKYKEVFALHR